MGAHSSVQTVRRAQFEPHRCGRQCGALAFDCGAPNRLAAFPARKTKGICQSAGDASTLIPMVEITSAADLHSASLALCTTHWPK